MGLPYSVLLGLWVGVADLVGVELLGFAGALLALPVAGVIQVIVADVFEHRRARLAATPQEASMLANRS